MADEALWQIAVDTGGTFTDACAVAPGGRVLRTKILSSGRLRAQVAEANSHDSATSTLAIDRDFGTGDGFLTGFTVQHATGDAAVTAWDAARRLLTLGRPLAISAGDAIDLSSDEEVPLLAARLLTGTAPRDALPPLAIRLATTRGTNALLESNGTPPLMVLSEGFGDLLEIGDQRRPDLFALEHRKHRLPLAAVVQVRGRISHAGAEITPFDADLLRDALSEIPEADRHCAGVALLNSYQNPAHELAAAELLREAGFAQVSVSSELAPVMRLLPRAQTTVTDAYLAPVMNRFVDAVKAGAGDDLLLMNSAGGLEDATGFRSKDSLLSGPAGGLVGALQAARAAGLGDLITFDMGGTSTDVARIGDGRLPYTFELRIGGAVVLAPALRIETVAAGGGSICSLRPEGLAVGPESAGAEPGPACYGRGGPLTLTDVNLLLGRIEADKASIPLDPGAARGAFEALRAELGEAGRPVPRERELLEGLLQIAVERMAQTIQKISVREGYDPAAHSLVAFGGAGPQHACGVADSLGITRILIPGDAGLLSARGVAAAQIERFASASVLRPLRDVVGGLDQRLRKLEKTAMAELGRAGEIHRRIAELRLAGQESTLEFEIGAPEALAAQFAARFETLFGYPPPDGKEIELVTLRVSAATPAREPGGTEFGEAQRIDEAHIESSPFFTFVAEAGWSMRRSADGSILLAKEPESPMAQADAGATGALAIDITRHRLSGVVAEMGAVLKRCAISTNVREREDFSCALLDAEGRLAINAPHIPVHLGALGLCVRDIAKLLEIGPGDIAITNHPAHGGSHLPDITLIAAAFDGEGRRIAFLANRAHHAEIGGIAPGSMPPDAKNLAEEGVVIPPSYLFRAGVPQFADIEALLTGGAYPTRNLPDNLADLQAQAAALRSAIAAVQGMDARWVNEALHALLHRSAELATQRVATLPFEERRAVERLDGGAEIHVALRREGSRLTVDFTGTSPALSENLNATPAIVRSATLYVLRLLLDEDLPLNEGLLAPVSIVLPECLLNPRFATDPAHCPPVVGGNVETSQRVVDALIKALRLQAGSQGTMNNLLFGNDAFGYYETIAGGAGAGEGYAGASALHTHMTNTAITDPEVLEWRYPVRLREFSVRRGSGGKGENPGGDGVVREFEFLEPLTLSILAEHRVVAPSGLAGGGDGAVGRQSWTAPDGTVHALRGRFSGDLPAGSRVRIETPGGGAYGAP